MNETTSVLEKEHGNASDSVDRETIDDNWDGELFALVAENADILVRCPWMSDAEVSLSTAMIAYPEPMTRENLSLYLSVVQQLLANRVTETEGPVEEEEESAQAEEVTQEDSKTKDAEKQTQKESGGVKQEQSVSKGERISETVANSVNIIAAKVGVTPNLVQSESQQSTQSAAKAEAAVSSSSSPLHATSGEGTGVPEIPASTNITSGSSFQEPRPMRTSDKDELDKSKLAIKSKVEIKQQIPTSEIPKTDVAVDSVVEAKPALNNSQLVADEQAEPEPAELSILNLENSAILGDTTELSDEKIEAIEGESALATIDYQLDVDEITDFVEAEEGIIDYFEEATQEPDDLQEIFNPLASEVVEYNLGAEEALAFELGSESNLFSQAETTSQEQFIQASLTIEEIEDSLIQLAERIETSEPGTIETVYEILDKIIEVPAKFEAQNDENIITEAEAQEELEELFAELFDELGIVYTPELIESLACLTLKWHLADEIEQLKDEEEIEKSLQGTGTHEIIKKLLAGLSVIKKAMAHAGSIGKSALQLYSFNFAT